MADTDKLTGFLTRKYFLERLEEEIRRVERYKRNLSLFETKTNFDYFEKNRDLKTNLSYALIRQLAIIFRKVFRTMDLAARYEGDSLTVMLPETDESGAKTVAARLCRETAGHEFKGENNATFRVALSIGIAVYPKHGKRAGELVIAANKGLQEALAKGGNGFEFCPVSLEETSSP